VSCDLKSGFAGLCNQLFFLLCAACNNIHHRFTNPHTDPRTHRSFHRHRKFHRQMHTYQRAIRQTTTQHNSTQHMETIISDNLERRNKTTRDITMINTTATTTQAIHHTLVHQVRAAAKTSISQLCLKVHPKPNQERRPVLDIRRNRHYQSHQIPAIIHRMRKQRRQPKERRVDDDSRTRVPRDQHSTIRRLWRA
jgi:hypothetical protein